jgi:hypothetical protein
VVHFYRPRPGDGAGEGMQPGQLRRHRVPAALGDLPGLWALPPGEPGGAFQGLRLPWGALLWLGTGRHAARAT